MIETLSPRATVPTTSRKELLAELEREFERPILPDLQKLREETDAALRRAEEHLRKSPIGRGDW